MIIGRPNTYPKKPNTNVLSNQFGKQTTTQSPTPLAPPKMPLNNAANTTNFIPLATQNTFNSGAFKQQQANNVGQLNPNAAQPDMEMAHLKSSVFGQQPSMLKMLQQQNAMSRRGNLENMASKGMRAGQGSYLGSEMGQQIQGTQNITDMESGLNSQFSDMAAKLLNMRMEGKTAQNMQEFDMLMGIK